MFRETPSPSLPPSTQTALAIDEKSKPLGARFLQVLALSHRPGRSYVAISTTHASSKTRAGTPASSTVSADSSGEPATIISIPSGPQTEEFVQLMVSKFGPLWTQRQTLVLGNGQAFEIGDYRVRLGEIRQGATSLGRGVVGEVEWVGEGDEEDWENAEGIIRPFWDQLCVVGARECFQVPGMNQGNGTVRQWCEILRLRG